MLEKHFIELKEIKATAFDHCAEQMRILSPEMISEDLRKPKFVQRIHYFHWKQYPMKDGSPLSPGGMSQW